MEYFNDNALTTGAKLSRIIPIRSLNYKIGRIETSTLTKQVLASCHVTLFLSCFLTTYSYLEDAEDSELFNLKTSSSNVYISLRSMKDEWNS